MSTEAIDPRYPIGKMVPAEYSEKEFARRLEVLRALPGELKKALNGLNADQLNTPYREGGWTVNQLVHHIADSHTTAYGRFLFALTEDNPTVKPYDENSWALLSDKRLGSIDNSVKLIEVMHERMVLFLTGLTQAELMRTVFHPQRDRNVSIWDLLGIYDWHSKHHVAHILELRKAKGW